MHEHGSGLWGLLYHTLVDTLPMVPVLFVLYALLEYVYHGKGYDLLTRARVSGGLGPLAGTLLGMIPQCGMSVFVTSLYVSGRVTMGTLVATYIATSDEAIPVLLAHRTHWAAVGMLLGVKLLAGLAAGYLVDLIGRRRLYRGQRAPEVSSYAVEVQLELKKTTVSQVFNHSLRRTGRIFAWVFAVSLLLGAVLELVDAEQALRALGAHPAIEVAALALFGLIPNCAASIAIAEGFLHSWVSFGGAVAGLCAGAGYGPIVLVKEGDRKEALLLLAIVLGFSMGAGWLVRGVVAL
jgi:hypothetical protein